MGSGARLCLVASLSCASPLSVWREDIRSRSTYRQALSNSAAA